MSWFYSLHHEDDLLTAIDRILTASDDDIVLSIPAGARILASEENFLLLKREAEAAGKRVAVQTSDPRGKLLAVKAGMTLVREGGAVAAPTRRMLSDILPPHGLGQGSAKVITPPQRSAGRVRPVAQGRTEHEEVPAPDLLSASSGDGIDTGIEPLYIPEFKRPVESVASTKRTHTPLRLPMPNFVRRRKLEAGVVLVGIIIALLVANEILPSVKIIIQPRSEALAFTMPLVVTVGTVNDGAISGQKISVEESDEKSVSATGTKEVTEKARGTVTITNAYSSSSQTLVATTRLVSQDGKLFRLDATTVVPGAEVEDGEITSASIDARVTADASGPEYNIGPSSFSIPGFQGTPKYTAFTVRSSQPMAGGAKGTARVVTEQDIAQARDGIGTGLVEKLQRKFKEQLPEGLTALDEATVETVTITTDVEAGAVADRVVGRAEGRRNAIVFFQQDFQRAIDGALAKRLPDGTGIVEGSMLFQTTVKERDFEKGTLVFSVEITARVAWKIDEGAARIAVAGKSEEEIRGWLSSQEFVDTAQVRFSPFWVSQAPTNHKRIKISVEVEP